MNPNYFSYLKSITLFHWDISRDKLLWVFIFKFLFKPNVKSGSFACNLNRWIFFCSVRTILAYIFPLYNTCLEYKTSFSCRVKGRMRNLYNSSNTFKDILSMNLLTKDENAQGLYFRYHNNHQSISQSYFYVIAQEKPYLPNLPSPSRKEFPSNGPLTFFIFLKTLQ